MGYYLKPKRHKFISENEVIIYAEKEYKYFIFSATKEIEYSCKIPNINNLLLVNNLILSSSIIFTKNGNKANEYEKHILGNYSWKIQLELLNDKEKVKRLIRKRKLEKIEQID